MENKIDIHNYKRRLEQGLDKIRNSEDVIDENKLEMIKFYNRCLADG